MEQIAMPTYSFVPKSCAKEVVLHESSRGASDDRDSNGCGTGGVRRQQTYVSHRQSVGTDAKDFPGGQVQFTATGTFAVSSKPVPLKNITWCIGRADGWCSGFAVVAGTIDDKGRAQCLPGASGTATVLAGSGIVGKTLPDQGYKLRVFGSAQLTCP
jgi:hypothetical protein